MKGEPADTHGGKREGAGRPSVVDLVQAVGSAVAHGAANQGSVSTLNASKPTKRQKRDAEYWIARLKRDAATDPKAEALLGSIEAGAKSGGLWGFGGFIPVGREFTLERIGRRFLPGVSTSRVHESENMA